MLLNANDESSQTETSDYYIVAIYFDMHHWREIKEIARECSEIRNMYTKLGGRIYLFPLVILMTFESI